ncbi:MAG: hypothetical protein AB7G40_07320 [Hyphomonadaceae bacterium]
MKEEIRRAVVQSAAARISGKSPTSVFSYDQGKYSFVNDTYDYDAGSHISQSSNGFYQYNLGAHVTLSVSGKNFTGYDYESGSHFSGSVNGGSVSIYDYNEGRYFSYSV